MSILFPKQSSSPLRARYLGMSAGVILSLLSACQGNTKENDTPSLPKKIIVQPKIEKKEIVKDTIDFSQCEDYNDIIALLEKKNYIKTIDPVQYFNNHHTFFQQANISQDIFIKEYNDSDIVKYGVYTDDYIRSHVDKYLKVINNMLISNSNFTQYIEHPEQIVTSGLHGVVRKIDPDIDQEKPKTVYKKRDDIPKGEYNDNTRYPRWEARDILDTNYVFVKSTALGYKEIGNNPTGDRTCLHGVKKYTVSCIVDIAKDLHEQFGLEICIKYKIFTLRGGTELDSHIDSELHENDHPGGPKFDIGIRGKQGIIWGIYFARLGVLKLQKGNLHPIRIQMVGYEIEVIPHAAHFDVWVIRKL